MKIKNMKVTLRRYRRRYPESLRNYRLVSLLSTGSSQDWNPLRILQNVMTDTVTVFVKLWIIRTVRRDFWV